MFLTGRMKTSFDYLKNKRPEYMMMTVFTHEIRLESSIKKLFLMILGKIKQIHRFIIRNGMIIVFKSQMSDIVLSLIHMKTSKSGF